MGRAPPHDHPQSQSQSRSPPAASPISPDSYPHIFDAILDAAPRDTLLALRPRCRYLRSRADLLLCRHATLKTFPGHTDLLSSLFAADGRLPHLYGHQALARSAPDRDRDCDSDAREHVAADGETEAGRLLAPFAHTQALNFVGNRSSADSVSDIAQLAERTRSLHTLRTYEYGGTRYPYLPLFAHASTWVHFVAFSTSTKNVTRFPAHVSKFVLNVDLGVPADTSPWAVWGEGYLRLEFAHSAPHTAPHAVEEMVVRFATTRNGGTALAESLRRAAPRGPVRSVRTRTTDWSPNVLPPVLEHAAHLWLLAPPNIPPMRLVVVDLPPPEDVHPSHFGMRFSGTTRPTAEFVQLAIKLLLRRVLGVGIPDVRQGFSSPQIDERLECIEFVSSDEYRARVGEEVFGLETDPSAFENQYD